MTQSSTYDKRIEMLRYLFPYHITANKLIIIELMENSSSGPTYLYCIAIATSLFWKFKLQKIKYDQKLMKSHLETMIKCQTLKHFAFFFKQITVPPSYT